MTNRLSTLSPTWSLWNELRPFSVGFENVFDHFNVHLDNSRTVNYPPYNINQLDHLNWNIEMALAGFSKKDIDVSVADGQLTIKSIVDKNKEESAGTIHKGISKRQFTRTFTLADDVVVNDAELKDGMLVVNLEKIVPEEKKPKSIKIK